MPGKRDIYISILKLYQRAVSKRQEFSSFSNENCRVRTPNLGTYTMKNESNWLHGLKILVYWNGKCTPQQRCQDGNHLRLSENGDLRIHVKFCVGEWPTDGMPPHNWYSTTSRSSQTTWWKSNFKLICPAGRASSALETDVQYITKHIKALLTTGVFLEPSLWENTWNKKEVENNT